MTGLSGHYFHVLLGRNPLSSYHLKISDRALKFLVVQGPRCFKPQNLTLDIKISPGSDWCYCQLAHPFYGVVLGFFLTYEVLVLQKAYRQIQN